jgi:hypothetical protein
MDFYGMKGILIIICKLNTLLRSKIGQHRLTGLALLHVHKNIVVPIDETINKFAKMKKINLVFCYLTTYQPYVFYLDIC